MNYVLVTPQPRGQITLPVRYREKYGIKPGVPVKVFDEGTGIRIRPVDEGNMTRAKYSRAEFKKVLNEISEYISKHGPLWTNEDDKLRAESLRKETLKWKRLNW